MSAVRQPEDVKTPAAYLLFYRRQTKRDLGGRTKEIIATTIASRSVSAAGSDTGLDTLVANANDTSSGSNGLPTPPDSDGPPAYERNVNFGPIWPDRTRTASSTWSDGSNEAENGSDGEAGRLAADDWSRTVGAPDDDGDLPDVHGPLRAYERPRIVEHLSNDFGRRPPSPTEGLLWDIGRDSSDKGASDVVFVDNQPSTIDEDEVHEIGGPAGPPPVDELQADADGFVEVARPPAGVA